MGRASRWLFGTLGGAVLLFVVGFPGLLDDLAEWADWIAWINNDWFRLALTVVGLSLIAFAALRRRRNEKPAQNEDSTTRDKRRLKDLYKVRGAAPGWFVSFTMGPFKTASEPLGHYATAIGEVTSTTDSTVIVCWRDRCQLPVEVPIDLLEARRVIRQRDGSQVQTTNAGLVNAGPGAMTISTGWNAHRQTPARAARLRVSDLSTEQVTEFEAEAVLETWIIPQGS